MKKISAIILLSSVLVGCASEVYNHGYTFEQSDIASLEINKSTELDVLTELGSPTSKSNFGEKIYYYINYKTEKVAFLTPKVIEQRVLAISIGENGLVTKISEYTLDDRNQIAFSEDKTEIHGNTLTPIEQILSNVGKFNKKK
jgi:outer membrane protein assembly factor BamE (lipoprotein component of BamABCDE complex)